jgi:hypothetical protein
MNHSPVQLRLARNRDHSDGSPVAVAWAGIDVWTVLIQSRLQIGRRRSVAHHAERRPDRSFLNRAGAANRAGNFD